jgi:hypothetical protein
MATNLEVYLFETALLVGNQAGRKANQERDNVDSSGLAQG